MAPSSLNLGTAGLWLYRQATSLGAPWLDAYLQKRLKRGKEDGVRFGERRGLASLPRPEGKLLWCHAASVGEALSVLSLLKALKEDRPSWSFLLTTGTVTSARLMEDRLPEGMIHQYVPVDRFAFTEAFLDHWKPDFALWMESELWPNLLAGIKKRGVPAVLLNARMSDRSFKTWKRLKPVAREIISSFSLCLAQAEEDRSRYEALGAREALCFGNLKYAADPLPCEEEALDIFSRALGDRPRWLMASTHPGEEAIALEAHRRLAQTTENLVTVIAPRHPTRGDEIEALIRASATPCARRSKGDALPPESCVYIADTLGEMGLFYRVAPVCCVAGSFTWGGHNPIEPALLGASVLFGPKMDNFIAIAEEILSEEAAWQVGDEEELVEKLGILLQDDGVRTRLGEKAMTYAEGKRGVLRKVVERIHPLLDVAEKR